MCESILSMEMAAESRRSMTAEEFAARNTALRHAIQTGAMYEAEQNPIVMEYKHNRVAIDAQQAEYAALIMLLVNKGVITWEEYYEVSIAALTAEVVRYEQRLTRMFGAKIKLG